MDANDLKERLRRLYDALAATQEGPEAISTHFETFPSGWSVLIDPGGRSATELGNAVLLAVHNLASLKDHLKKKMMTSLQRTPAVVENAINASRDLGLIVDLANIEKHGSPLARPPRSATNPRITDLHQFTQLRAGGAGSVASVSWSPTQGLMTQGDVGVVIDGKVVDERGARICGRGRCSKALSPHGNSSSRRSSSGRSDDRGFPNKSRGSGSMCRHAAFKAAPERVWHP